MSVTVTRLFQRKKKRNCQKGSILKTQTSKSRQMQTGHRQMWTSHQASVDECASVVESLDGCRQCRQCRQIKNLTEWQVVPFCCYGKYATVGYICMQIYNFVNLFVITPSFFKTNQFISNQPSNSKLLSNFQGSTPFY